MIFIKKRISNTNPLIVINLIFVIAKTGVYPLQKVIKTYLF
jgi:hypothetical protein